MAHDYILETDSVHANDIETAQGIKSVRIAQVAITINGVSKWEFFRVPDTLKSESDVSDWIEKAASAREVELGEQIKTSALKV